MKRAFKWFFIVVILLAVGGVMIMQALKPTSVEVERLAIGNLADTFSAQGAIVPKNSVILSANAPGEILSLPFEMGTTVKAGALLWTLDDETYRNRLEDQICSLKMQQSSLYSQNRLSKTDSALRTAQLETQLTDAEYQFERLFGGEKSVAQATMEGAATAYTIAARKYRDAKEADKLDDTKYTDAQLYELRNLMDLARQNRILTEIDNTKSAKEYYNSLILATQAQIDILSNVDTNHSNITYAAVEQLNVTIRDLEKKLESLPPSAPYDAVVWQVMTEVGDFVSENQPIVRLYPGGELLLEAELLAADAMRLSVGQQVDCQLADEQKLTAKISFISPVAHETLSTLGVVERRCLIRLTPVGLPPGTGAGYPVDLDFSVTAAEGVLSIPASSIVPTSTGSGVYLLLDGKAILTPVKTGLRSGGRVQLLSGVEEGDAVILDPFDKKITDKKRVAATNEV
jgi:multidrug efflux pump subunit AcrA (membrane-fusion protein)